MDRMDSESNTPENYLQKVCEGLEELRRGNKNDIRESQIEAVQGLNKITSDLNKYLFTVATFLIPILFSLVTLNEIRQKLDQKDGVLIALATIFLFVSLTLGFIHMVSESKFFKKTIYNADKKLKLWSSISFWPSAPLPNKVREYVDEYDSIKKKVDEISDEIESESTNIFLIGQGTFSLIGILLIIVVIFGKIP